jgi:hypothetical protein
MCARVLACLL